MQPLLHKCQPRRRRVQHPLPSTSTSHQHEYARPHHYAAGVAHDKKLKRMQPFGTQRHEALDQESARAVANARSGSARDAGPAQKRTSDVMTNQTSAS